MLFVLCVLRRIGVVVFFFSSRRRHTRCALVTGVQTCALPIWGASAMQTPQPGLWIVLAAAAGLAAVSWIDDLGSLPAAPRLAAQALAVAAAVPFLAAQGPVFQGLLPNWLDAAAAAFAWLWFINLFNFRSEEPTSELQSLM